MKCPKCGKRIAGRVNFCPYCGYKDENGAMGGSKSGALKEKLKNMPPEKKKKLKLATIITSVSLVVLIVVIILAVTLSSIFRLAKVKKVELGMTKAQVEKILGTPNDIDDAYVPVAGGDIDVYLYYESKVAKILKEIDKNADSDVDDWDDLDKALEKEEKLYNKLEKMKYKSIVIGFDRSYERVISIAFNKQTKYSKSNPYNSWGTKTISDFSLNKQTLALHEDLSTGDFYYTATYKDGSYRKECIYRLSGFSTETEGRKTVEFDNDWATKQLNLEVKTANVVAESANANWGNAKGTGYYVNGQTVALTATPYDNYTFDGWYQGDTLVSRDNPYSFKYTVNNQTQTYTARFSIIDYAKVPEYENFIILQSGDDIRLIDLKDETITEVVVPDGITNISNIAFAGCSKLTSITIPATLDSLGNETWSTAQRQAWTVFDDCRNLERIVVDRNNKIFSSQDGILYNKSKTEIVYVPNKISGAIALPEGLLSICNDAFYNRDAIDSIVIPNGVTSIRANAFDHCSATSITLPVSITKIDTDAFLSCKLNTVNIQDFDAWCNIEFASDKNGYVNVNDSNPLNGGAYLYLNGECLSGDIVVHNGVKTIPAFTFKNCEITSIELPTSLKSIGAEAFYACNALASVNIPDGVTYIGDGAFMNCGLETISIPNSIEYVGASAVSALNHNIYYHDGYEYWYLGNTTNPYLVLVHGAYCNSAIIHDDCKIIMNGVFSGREISQITIPNNITQIGSRAFNYCRNLTSLIIPNSVKYIDAFAFQGCNNLTHVTIPNSVVSIGNYAFDNCSGLTSITFNGTKNEWNNVSKGLKWDNNTGNYVIHCTDAVI